ncbi:uncharacterized protein CC84DRAFT_1085846 [Paraphaeosphaeria sporulosa]|uniref:Uncharacterized protein n=1 Tax=Paraphaeosphaeria sporulosa TaxID=1460663 RepID=A0A177CQA9_9PLEO|nr:uncharacterized protein CC84DRAFT_1085846 [Paraphaeosphaeria sporulosa]OAG09138.1 hypothetical protein CC84DRAFT_1085846 [Paraphaeosphaeria sporulosa]
MKKKAKVVPPCSHAEFESLPEPLRRKYFSSLERLRIAEEHALHEQQGEHKHQYHPFQARPSRSRSTAIHRSILPLGSSRRRLARAESLKHDHYVAQADASFFLSLPPKVQRSAFSREEQTILVGRCEIPPSTTGSPLPPARRTHLHYDEEQRFSDFHFGFNNDGSDDHALARDHDHNHYGAALHRGRSLRRRSSVSSADISPTRGSPYSPAQELDADTEGSLLYLDTMSPVASHPSRASFRRTLSLTNIPLRSSISSAPLAPEPLSARGTAPWHQRAHSQSVSGRRSSHTPQAPVFDPEATHYRDAETRKKLQFLASPQKFDEAVEFGFPSSGDDTMPPRYQLPPISTDARNFSRDVQSFLKDDRMSFLDDHEEEDNKGLESDAESVADFESPVTPSSVGHSFRYHRKQSSNFSSSIDSNGVPLIHPVTGRLNREMTLRMTLTRPDLRADEEQLYGWQGQKHTKDDPFALEDLPLSDDMNGTKGPFYVKPKPHGNLVSRLFKRSSKKGR